MMVEIFDVEHGACTLITTTSGQHVLIDCGHKAGTYSPVNALAAAVASANPYPWVGGQGNPLGLGGLGAAAELFSPPPNAGWRPSEMLKARSIVEIDRLIVSNYDEDHLSDLPKIREERIHIHEIVGNPTVTMQALRSLKPNGIGNGVAALIDLKENFGHTFSPREIQGVYLYYFWVIHNPLLLQNTNDLSLVTFVSINDLHMVFPGDIESSGWEILLQRADFLAHLKRVNVFVASHHGRVNGYHADVFRNGRCSPALVIISDKSIMHGTQENAATRYGGHARGVMIDGNFRKVLTTRNDGHIRFSFNPNGTARVDIG